MGLYLPKFTFKKSLSDYCTSKTNTGSYSCVQASFLFKREFNYYLIQIYIPCAMLVLVSFVGFWMDGKKDLTARTIIVLGSLLTMACMTSLMNTRMPSVSYTKRIDVWTGQLNLLEFYLISQTFFFLANRRLLDLCLCGPSRAGHRKLPRQAGEHQQWVTPVQDDSGHEEDQLPQTGRHLSNRFPSPLPSLHHYLLHWRVFSSSLDAIN